MVDPSAPPAASPAAENAAKNNPSCKELEQKYGVCKGKVNNPKNLLRYHYHTDKILNNHKLIKKYKLKENEQFNQNEVNTELESLTQKLTVLKNNCGEKTFTNKCKNHKDIPKIQERDKIIKKHVLGHFLVEALKMSKDVFSEGPTYNPENIAKIMELHKNIDIILGNETDENKKQELIGLVNKMESVKDVVTEVKEVFKKDEKSIVVQDKNDGFEVLNQIVNFLKSELEGPLEEEAEAAPTVLAIVPEANQTGVVSPEAAAAQAAVTPTEEVAAAQAVDPAAAEAAAAPSATGTPPDNLAEAERRAAAEEEAKAEEEAAQATNPTGPPAAEAIKLGPLNEDKDRSIQNQRERVEKAAAKQKETENAAIKIQAARAEAAEAEAAEAEAAEAAAAEAEAAAAEAAAAAAEKAAAEMEKKENLIRIIYELKIKAENQRIEPPKKSTEAAVPIYTYTTKGILLKDDVNTIINELISVEENQLKINDQLIDNVNGILNKIGATSCELSDNVSQKLDQQIDVFKKIDGLFDTLTNGITENEEIPICGDFTITLTKNEMVLKEVEEEEEEEDEAAPAAAAEAAEAAAAEAAAAEAAATEAVEEAVEENRFVINPEGFAGGSPKQVYESLKFNNQKLTYDILFDYMKMSFTVLHTENSKNLIDLKRIFVTNAISVFYRALIKNEPCESLIDTNLRLKWDNDIDLINENINKDTLKDTFVEDNIIDDLGFIPVRYLNKLFDQMINNLKETNKFNEFNQIPEYNGQIKEELFTELKINVSKLTDESDISKYNLFVELVKKNEQIESLYDNTETYTKDPSQLRTLVESIIKIFRSDNNDNITVRTKGTIENGITFNKTYDSHLLPLFENYLNTIKQEELQEESQEELKQLKKEQNVNNSIHQFTNLAQNQDFMKKYKDIIEVYINKNSFRIKVNNEENRFCNIQTETDNILSVIYNHFDSTASNDTLEVVYDCSYSTDYDDIQEIILKLDEDSSVIELVKIYWEQQKVSSESLENLRQLFGDGFSETNTDNMQEALMINLKQAFDKGLTTPETVAQTMSFLNEFETIITQSDERLITKQKEHAKQDQEHAKQDQEHLSQLKERENEFNKLKEEIDTFLTQKIREAVLFHNNMLNLLDSHQIIENNKPLKVDDNIHHSENKSGFSTYTEILQKTANLQQKFIEATNDKYKIYTENADKIIKLTEEIIELKKNCNTPQTSDKLSNEFSPLNVKAINEALNTSYNLRISQLLQEIFFKPNNQTNANTVYEQIQTIQRILNDATTIDSKVKRYKESCRNTSPEEGDPFSVIINGFTQGISNESNNYPDALKFVQSIPDLKSHNIDIQKALDEINNLKSDPITYSILKPNISKDAFMKYVFTTDFVSKEVNKIFMYLTNPFNTLISVRNSLSKNVSNGKVSYSNENVNDNFTCMNSNCVLSDARLQLYQNYGPFDRIFLPESKEEGNSNIPDSEYINSIISEFTSPCVDADSGKNFLIMHYGFSGTGKTYFEKLISEKINANESITKNTKGIYGKLGKKTQAANPWEKNDKNKTAFTYVDFEFNNQKILTTDKFFLNNSILYKRTLNNDDSSRFHKYTKYSFQKNNLYYYDLAGFESPLSIIKEFVPRATSELIDSEFNTTMSGMLELSNSIYGKTNVSHPKSVPIINEYLQNIINDGETMTKDDKRNRLDTLFESYFINHSLDILKEQLISYKNNYSNSEYKGLYIPQLDIKQNTKFEKIVMFGFIRNDKGYFDQANDETFLQGTQATLKFLNDLANPNSTKQFPNPEITEDGTIESPFQPKQLLIESANKVAETAFESAMEGGGIIDKTVKDTDRAIVIMVTFCITFLSTYMKNTLSDKGVLKNKTEEMVTLVAFYSFFTLLFSSLIELSSVDTMYMLTYLLAFGIIYITLNTYQEPKKRSLIKDRIEGEVIQEYKEMDSNLLVTWMMSSIGVIFV